MYITHRAGSLLEAFPEGSPAGPGGRLPPSGSWVPRMAGRSPGRAGTWRVRTLEATAAASGPGAPGQAFLCCFEEISAALGKCN